MCSTLPRVFNSAFPCCAGRSQAVQQLRRSGVRACSSTVDDSRLRLSTLVLNAQSVRHRLVHSLAAHRTCCDYNRKHYSNAILLGFATSQCISTGSIGPFVSLNRLFSGANGRNLTRSGTHSWDTFHNFAILLSSTTSVRRQSTETDEEYRERTKRHAERLKKNTWRGFIAFLAMMGITVVAFVITHGSPIKDPDGNEVRDEFTDLPIFQRYLYRAWAELTFFKKLIEEPSRSKLLPDPLRDPYYQPPYTLVIEMNGVLVHPDWTYNTGWRFKKRNAVDFFIQQVGYPVFEVVIYTSEQGFTAFPIIDNLDPNGLIMYRLFRDATKYLNGHHVKDLSKLNRDLSKVILVEWDPNAFQLNPENALRIPRWKGQDEESDLVELAGLLKTIAASGAKDVRPILEYYSRFDDPMKAFKENQQKLQEAQSSKKLGDDSSLTKSWTGRMFGYRRHN